MAKLKILKFIENLFAQAEREYRRQSECDGDIAPILRHCHRQFSSAINTALPLLATYRNIFLQAKNPICILSPSGIIKQCNPAHKHLYADTDFKQVGNSLSGFLGKVLFDQLLTCIAEEKPFQHEMTLRKKDGRLMHVNIYASGIVCEEDPFSVIILISRDQTQRRESDRMLKQFKHMVDHSNDAFFVIDRESGQFVDANTTACTQLGYQHEEMLQLNVADISPRIKTDHDWQRHKAWLLSKKRHLYETIHQASDGRQFPVEISIDHTEDNGSSLFLAVARDISERKAAEEREQQTNMQWKQMLDSIPDIVTIQGLDNRITQCNQATLKTFGIPRAEIIGKKCYELFTGSHSICDNCPAQHKTSFTPYSEEVFNPRLDCTFAINISPIFDSAGKLIGVTHFAKDLTEQKQLEAQLRHIQKMDSLGQLAGEIAHDFNNVLGAIIGYTQLAKAQLPEETKAQEALEQVLVGGKRAANLVEQILTFSRKAEGKRTPVALQKIIVEVLKLMQPSIPSTIKTIKNIDLTCPPIMADSNQIHQMIMNLCTNAYQELRTLETGELEISLQKIQLKAPIKRVPSGDFLLLSIRDSGRGIDQHLLDKIFEPYFTTKKHGEGTGLGLAVVHGIVRDYNGYILVDSEPNRGTCFSIYLPLPPNTH
jgi:PAS domain S-box-containing protein